MLRFVAILFILSGPGIGLAQAEGKSGLIYSAWSKFCFKGAGETTTCFIGIDVRSACRFLLGSALVIEDTGSNKSVLRIEVGRSAETERGLSLVIDDDGTALVAKSNCSATRCSADFLIDAEMILRLKRGQTMQVSGVGGENLAMALPLTGFADVYDGPSQEPRVFEEDAGKLRQQLEQRAAEGRDCDAK